MISHWRTVLLLLAALGAASAILLLRGLASDPASALAPWTLTSNNLQQSRYSFRATTLTNGKVLIEGGFADPGGYSTESELYDPTTNSWSVTGSLIQGRGEHTATLLTNGKVLVAGGYAGPVLTSAELYDPTTGSWSSTGSMHEVRTRHSATLLADGRVLVAGGWNGGFTAGAEIYDPTSGMWTATNSMSTPRANHSAIRLPDGRVLVAGGSAINGTGHALATAEIFNPSTGNWTPTGRMTIEREHFALAALNDGRILAVGGWTNGPNTATAEIYDPATGVWTSTGSMHIARFLHGEQLVALADGRVLAAGGEVGQAVGTSEVYDPTAGTWSDVNNMNVSRCGGASSKLLDGRVIVVSGTDCGSGVRSFSAEVYDPTSQPPTAPTPSPTVTAVGLKSGCCEPSGAVGGLVDLTTNGSGSGGSGTMMLLVGLLLAFAATGAAAVGFRRVSIRR